MNDKPVTINLGTFPLTEFGYQDDPVNRVRGAFPLTAARGTKNTAVVYVEIAPGRRLPTHTDSAEELVLILEGRAEVTVGDETTRAATGDIAVIPALEPHSLYNDGNSTLRMLGFFSSNTVMSTFEKPLLPAEPPPGSPFGERTVLAPFPVELEQPRVQEVA